MSSYAYQHSGESKKIAPVAQQASINEDLEKRRRQLDETGEARKIIIANQVSHIIEEIPPNFHLHHVPETFPPIQPAPSILTEAAEAVSHAAKSATDTVVSATANAAHAARGAADTVVAATSNATHAAADAARGAADTVVTATANATHVAADAARSATDTVVSATTNATHAAVDAAAHLSEEASAKLSIAKEETASLLSRAADFVSTKAKSAAEAISATATEAAHKASDAAAVVGHKTIELAEGAANKAHQVADSLSHFTALVTVRAAEESERARRMTSGEETNAVLNAFKVADLIHALGPAFYRQAPANQLYATKLLEEIERRWRLNSSYGSVGASNARSLGKLVTSNLHDFEHFIPRHQQIRAQIRNTEDKERTRRLNDSDEVYAILNAFALSDLIHSLGWPFAKQESFGKQHRAFASTLLEENERRWRIRTQKVTHAEDSAHLLMDVVATNIYKFNSSTRAAANIANDFAGKLANATSQVLSTFNERSREFAQSTVHKAQCLASDISRYTSLMYCLALEEGERKRRLIDDSEAWAMQNAWNQSALIRQLEWPAYRQSTSRSYFPTRYLELLEQRRRIAHDDHYARKNARNVSQIVLDSISKFELAHEYASELTRAREVAAHSRLNPKARPFVPHQQGAGQKAEPIAQQRSNIAAGAQR